MTTLREEILIEASRRYPKQGYGQDELLDVAFEFIEKRIDSKINIMRGTKYNNGMSTVFYKIDALEEFKKELLTE